MFKRLALDNGLQVRVKFAAADNTQRIVFDVPHMRERMDPRSNRYGKDVSDEFINRRLRAAVNKIIKAGDKPNAYREQSYFVIIETPFQVPEGPEVHVGFPLHWASPSPRDAVVYRQTNKNFGKITTWMAFDHKRPQPRQGDPVVKLSYAINPFLKKAYGDKQAELLAAYAAQLHFAEHGTKQIGTYQTSRHHSAVVGFEPDAQEFELQDFVGNVIFVD